MTCMMKLSIGSHSEVNHTGSKPSGRTGLTSCAIELPKMLIAGSKPTGFALMRWTATAAPTAGLAA